MSDESKPSKYPILDDIEVPKNVLANWQVTADLLAEFAGTPVALIMRVHAHEIEVFVASLGPGNVYHPGEKASLDTGRYCETVMSTRRELLVPNALKDSDWVHNPDIELGMISYCGMPLTWPNGVIFGTICILDNKENDYAVHISQLIARFRDSIQLSLEIVYNASAERTKAEELVKESHKSLLAVLNGLDAIVYVADTKTYELLFVNNIVKELFGDIVGQTCWKVLQTGQAGPCSFCTNDKLVDAAGNPTGICRWEFQNTVNGSWYDVRDRVLEWSDGRMVRLEIATDITERKRMEEALRESEAKLSTLFASMTEMVVQHELLCDEVGKPVNYRIIDCNAAYTRITGITRENAVGRLATEVYGAEEPPYLKEFSEVALSGEPYQYETYYPPMDKHFYISVVSTEKNRFATVTTDITERKQTEDALRENREKYKANIDNSFDVIFTLNAEGSFQFVSRAWERHFGYSIKGILGKNFTDFVHPDDITPLTTYLSRVISSGKSKASPPFRVKHRDGSWRNFIANGSRYANAAYEWLFIGVAHDITEQLAAEQSLLHAIAVAETANVAKSQFLSTMSHEIRTPMNSVLGVIQLLQQDELTQEQRKLTEIAMQSGKKLVDLLNDILDLAKIEAGKIELEIADFDLPSMISDTINMLALQAREKGLRLTSSQDRDVPSALKGDAGRLRQIIVNLVSNSIKFTPKGTIVLHIQKCSEDAHSTTLSFLIRDSGIGIAPDKLEHIFELFTQANGSTTRTYGGTGLGLAICKRLVELMGGTIVAESIEGEGSTFRFTVVLEKQIEASLSLSAIIDETDKDPFSATGIRILLTEDDPVARNIVSRLLKSEGYLVDVASDGKEAVDALKNNDYALVLMDCMMPEMSGYEVTAVIRDPASSVRRHDIPVIALTGNAMKQDVEMCIAAGMDDHLPKPVLFPDLLAMLEKYLKGGNK